MKKRGAISPSPLSLVERILRMWASVFNVDDMVFLFDPITDSNTIGNIILESTMRITFQFFQLTIRGMAVKRRKH